MASITRSTICLMRATPWWRAVPHLLRIAQAGIGSQFIESRLIDRSTPIEVGVYAQPAQISSGKGKPAAGGVLRIDAKAKRWCGRKPEGAVVSKHAAVQPSQEITDG